MRVGFGSLGICMYIQYVFQFIGKFLALSYVIKVLVDTQVLLRLLVTSPNTYITVLEYQSYSPSWDGPRDVRAFIG